MALHHLHLHYALRLNAHPFFFFFFAMAVYSPEKVFLTLRLCHHHSLPVASDSSPPSQACGFTEGLSAVYSETLPPPCLVYRQGSWFTN